MFNATREKTLNTFLENAAQCGATDLMALAIEQGADEHKKHASQRALTYCLDIGNREGFDLLIKNNAFVSYPQFNNSSLYRASYRGEDIAPDVQRHFISTLLTHDKPNPFSGNNLRSECCLIHIIDYARDDIFALIDEAIDITSLLKREDIVPFINRLSNRCNDNNDAFKTLLITLLERYRPLTFPAQEGDESECANEVAFTKQLFQFGMSTYLEQLNAAGEITLHRKQVLDKVDSIEDLLISIDTNPNIMLSEYALNSLLQCEDISALTPEDTATLIRHTEADRRYRSVSFERTLDTFATHERIDLIKVTIDTATSLTATVEQDVYAMIYRAFKNIPSDHQAITFLNNMLSQTPYREALMARWKPDTDAGYYAGSCAADWLLSSKEKPARLSALLGILPITAHVLTRYAERIGNRNSYDENALEDVYRKPYLLNAIFNHDALSDELKSAFRKAISYQFEYADRNPTAAIKMLTSKKKIGDRLKGELVARFIIATPHEKREAFAYFIDKTAIVLTMVEFLNLSPMEAITEFPINTEAKGELLKQAC